MRTAVAQRVSHGVGGPDGRHDRGPRPRREPGPARIIGRLAPFPNTD